MQTVEKAYDEIVDFLARGSTPAEIVRFRPSGATQDRTRYLLDRNKTGELTDDEADELDRLGQPTPHATAEGPCPSSHESSAS